MKRRDVLFMGAGAAVIGGTFLLWPATKHAAYPLMREMGVLDPLWTLDTDKVEATTAEDAARLDELTASLERAVARIEAAHDLLSLQQIDTLGASERKLIRELWWQAFEPIVAIDDLKHRYRGWYGLDYVAHPLLHSRAYALGFAGLCAQVEAGLRLVRAFTGNAVAQTLIDEAVPEMGLPSRTWSAVRNQLGRARDLLYVPVGAEWYGIWIRRHLAADRRLPKFVERIDSWSTGALKALATPSVAGVQNKLELVQRELFHQWFPLQKNFAEWAGDTRVAAADRRLVSDAQLEVMQTSLQCGDVILERRNWYLSNVGLPGFWPHAALYTGTASDIVTTLGADPEVTRAYGDLGAYFGEHFPEPWKMLGQPDEKGHAHVILEAVSEGVVAASLEHSCAADYVAALRPRKTPLERARAIERAFSFYGRPYDFNFDFATDDVVVCSELVVKSFEPTDSTRGGLGIPFAQVAGRRVVAPTDIVRHFAAERGDPARSFDFVYFLDGREKEGVALVADEAALAATIDRPKWDIAQP
jgi:hypothetical protein